MQNESLRCSELNHTTQKVHNTLPKVIPPIILMCYRTIYSLRAERKAHPPLGARAEVSHGVEVVITGKHLNRTAPSGWMVRLVLLLIHIKWFGAQASEFTSHASTSTYRIRSKKSNASLCPSMSCSGDMYADKSVPRMAARTSSIA